MRDWRERRSGWAHTDRMALALAIQLIVKINGLASGRSQGKAWGWRLPGNEWDGILSAFPSQGCSRDSRDRTGSKRARAQEDSVRGESLLLECGRGIGKIWGAMKIVIIRKLTKTSLLHFLPIHPESRPGS